MEKLFSLRCPVPGFESRFFDGVDVPAVRVQPSALHLGHPEALARERVPAEAAQRQRRRRRRCDAADDVGTRVTDGDASCRQGDDSLNILKTATTCKILDEFLSAALCH